MRKNYLEKLGFKEAKAEDYPLENYVAFSTSSKNFKLGAVKIEKCRILAKGNGSDILILADSKTGPTCYVKSVEEEDPLINHLISTGRMNAYRQTPVRPERRDQSKGKFPMQTPATWVLAKIDEEHEINTKHLKQLIEDKVVIPLLNNKLKKHALKRLPNLKQKDLSKIYLVPMAKLNRIDQSIAIPGYHMRSITSIDSKYSVKGIGNRGIYFGNRTLQIGEVFHEVPFGLFRNAREVYGGMQKSEVIDTYVNFKKLKRGWLKFRKEEPEIAKKLGVYDEIPFVEPVVAFTPLETPALSFEHEVYGKSTIIPMSNLRNTTTNGGPKFSNLRLLITHNGFTNNRLDELNSYLKFYKQHEQPPVEFSQGRSKLKILPDGKSRADLLETAQNRLLAAMYISRKYAKLAMHKTHSNVMFSNSVMAPKDFTLTRFADTNGMEKATKTNKAKDIYLLHKTSTSLANTLGIPAPIEMHDLYPHVILGI